MGVYRGADFWVGYLSHTVAVAATLDRPQAVLKNAIGEFLAEHPDPVLVQAVKSTLKEKP
jgi:hypothetical protein